MLQSLGKQRTSTQHQTVVVYALLSDQRNDPSSYVALTHRMYSVAGFRPVIRKRVCLPWYTSFTTPVPVAIMSLYFSMRSAFLVGGLRSTETKHSADTDLLTSYAAPAIPTHRLQLASLCVCVCRCVCVCVCVRVCSRVYVYMCMYNSKLTSM